MAASPSPPAHQHRCEAGCLRGLAEGWHSKARVSCLRDACMQGGQILVVCCDAHESCSAMCTDESMLHFLQLGVPHQADFAFGACCLVPSLCGEPGAWIGLQRASSCTQCPGSPVAAWMRQRSPGWRRAAPCRHASAVRNTVGTVLACTGLMWGGWATTVRALQTTPVPRQPVACPNTRSPTLQPLAGRQCCAASSWRSWNYGMHVGPAASGGVRPVRRLVAAKHPVPA